VVSDPNAKTRAEQGQVSYFGKESMDERGGLINFQGVAGDVNVRVYETNPNTDFKVNYNTSGAINGIYGADLVTFAVEVNEISGIMIPNILDPGGEEIFMPMEGGDATYHQVTNNQTNINTGETLGEKLFSKTHDGRDN
jgi:hypothetical protein